MATFTEPVYVYFDPGFMIHERRTTDKDTEIHLRVRNGLGAAVDLTSVTVTINIDEPEGARIVTAFATTLTDATAGKFKFVLTSTETTKFHPGGGDYRLLVRMDSARGTNDLIMRIRRFTGV